MDIEYNNTDLAEIIGTHLTGVEGDTIYERIQQQFVALADAPTDDPLERAMREQISRLNPGIDEVRGGLIKFAKSALQTSPALATDPDKLFLNTTNEEILAGIGAAIQATRAADGPGGYLGR